MPPPVDNVFYFIIVPVAHRYTIIEQGPFIAVFGPKKSEEWYDEYMQCELVGAADAVDAAATHVCDAGGTTRGKFNALNGVVGAFPGTVFFEYDPDTPGAIQSLLTAQGLKKRIVQPPP